MKNFALSVWVLCLVFNATAQNVGIGTTTPQSKLHISTALAGDVSNGESLLIENSNTSETGEAAIVFKNNGPGGTGSKYWYTGLNHGRNFTWAYGTAFINNTHLLVLDTTGKLGIGTSLPQNKLHIVNSLPADGGAAQSLLIENDNFTSTGEVAVVFKNAGPNGTGSRSWYAGLNQNSSLSFGYGSNFSGSGTRMIIDSAGKVGIGTTNPQARLHVADSSVVFSAAYDLPTIIGDPPVSGPGRRMMWYADKAAFRVGTAFDDFWDKDEIGIHSTAIGFANKAPGEYSTAIGFGAGAFGDHSVAIGYGNIASGNASTAMGVYSQATGASSLSLGFNSKASGLRSIALGDNTEARSYLSFVAGRYNDVIWSSDFDNWIETDPLFMLGNGNAYGVRKNALTILKNAKMGINLSAPQAMFHIKRKGISSGEFLRNAAMIIEDDTTSYINLSHPDENETGIISGSRTMLVRSGIIFKNDNTLEFRTGGNVTRMALATNGNLTITGLLAQSSDISLKKNITSLQTFSPEKLQQISGYNYRWKDETKDNHLQTGLLAQEVEQVFPELVYTDGNGLKSINYTGLIPHLLEAVKMLQLEVRELRKEKKGKR